MSTCGEHCITDFGAQFNGGDDTPAWQLAVDTITNLGGGKLKLPRGTSRTYGPIEIRQPGQLLIEGMGAGVTKIENGSSDLFRLGRPIMDLQQLNFTSFRELSIESLSSNGGDIFTVQGDTILFGCSWSHLRLRQRNPGKQIFRRVTTSANLAAGIYDCLWEHLHMEHGDIAVMPCRPLAPAFEISAPTIQFQANTFSNLRCENSWEAPFFKFSCGAGQARNNGCLMSEIDFRQCYGGMVRWDGAGNWLCKGLVQYDLQGGINPSLRTQRDGLYVGRVETPAVGAGSRHMTFVGCDRRSGTRGPGLVDISMQAAADIVLINCGDNASNLVDGYVVNAHDSRITWIGVQPIHETSLLGKAQAVRIGNGAVRAPVIVPFPPIRSPLSPLTSNQGGVPHIRLPVNS